MSGHSRKGKRMGSVFSSQSRGDETRADLPIFADSTGSLPPLLPPVPYQEPQTEAYQRSDSYIGGVSSYLTIVEKSTADVMYVAVVRQMQVIRRAIEEASASELPTGEYVKHVNGLLETLNRLHVVRSQMNDNGVTDRDVLGY